MARWKACVEFLLSVIGLLFLSLTVEALEGKRCQDSLLSGGGRSVQAKISGGRGSSRGIFFGFYETTPCLKKRPTFTTCYNFYIHSSIATIFGTNVAKKVGNQNVLYFPTSSNKCVCTTWGNKKPGNCVFSLECCMLFHQNNTKQF